MSTPEKGKQIKKLIQLESDPKLALFDELQEANTTLKEIRDKPLPEPPKFPEIPAIKFPDVQKVSLEGVNLITIKGDPGKDGDSPSDEQIKELIKPLIPTPIPGYTPIKGKDYFDGDDGVTPQKGVDYFDGKDANEAGIAEKVLQSVESNLPKLGEKIRDALELLNGDERLDIKSIKGLVEEFKKLNATIEAVRLARVGGARKVPILKRIRLTPQLDGVTKTFTLPLDTVSIYGLWGTEFPVTFDDNDWTFVGRTLTLASNINAPAAGQTLIALVETLFY